MKLKLTPALPSHGEGVAAAAWVQANGLYLISIADDGTWHQYTQDGEHIGRVFVFSSPAAGQKASAAATAATDSSSSSSSSAVASNPAGGTEYGVCDVAVSSSQDLLACACADGTLRMFSVVRADAAAAFPPSTGSGSGPNAAAAAAATAAAMKAAAERSGGRLLAVREEKRVVASSGGEGLGAVTCVRWAPDNATLATGGEDGCVKIWSRACMLRTTLVSAGRPIYSLSFNAEGSSLVYASAKELCVVPVGEGGTAGVSGAAGGAIPAGLGGIAAGRPGGPGGIGGGRGLAWKAHGESGGGGVVTRVDWSPLSNRIVSGGEDGRFKVWDPLGRLLSSGTCGAGAVVTSLVWAPGLASSNTAAGGDVLASTSSTSASSSSSTSSSSSCCAYSGASSGVSAVNERFLVGSYGTLRVVDGSSGVVTHLVASSPASSSLSSSSSSDSKIGDASDSKVGGGSRRGLGVGGLKSAAASTSTTAAATGTIVSDEAIEAALGPQLPPFCGSVTAVSFSNDGSLCCIGTGNGSVVVANPVNIGASTPEGTFTVTLAGPRLLKAVDTGVITAASTTNTSESVASSASSVIDIEARDRITGFSLGHGHLLVLTPSHLAIYTGAHSSSSSSTAASSNTPSMAVQAASSHNVIAGPSHSLDNLKSPIRFVSQAPRHFVAIDANGGIAVYSYDGRLLCSPKPPAGMASGIRVESLSSSLVSISHDVLAICDKTEGMGMGMMLAHAGAAGAVPSAPGGVGGVAAATAGGRVVRLWDIKSGGGRALPAPIVHHQGITFLSLSNGTVPPVTSHQQPPAGGDKEKPGSLAVAAAAAGVPAGGLADRRLFLIDASADGYLTPVIKPSLSKIATMVDSGAWNTTCDTLTLLTDGSVVTWLAPTAASAAAPSTAGGAAAAAAASVSGGGSGLMVSDGTGMDLASRAKVKAEPSIAALIAGANASGSGLGSSLGGASGSSNNASATILCHCGSRLSVRRPDGTVVHAKASAFGQILHECVASNKWKEALRLARFVKAEALWAGLAALALSGPRPHLETAESALAAIKAVDKLSWVNYVRSLPLPERRNAEMAAYRRQFDEAEAILLQATPPMLYRALKLNVRMHRWERAMQLALQHAQAVANGKAGPNAVPFVDLVLWYRQRHNESAKSDETSEIFLKAAAQLQSQGITFNDATIQAKKQAEREKEAARAQALASSSSGGGGGAAKAGGSMSILGGLGGGSGTSKSVGGGSGGAMASATKVDDDFDAPEL